MNEFVQIPANKQSIDRRKPIYGRGINDADYLISAEIDGKLVLCPFYRKWTGMFARCYSNAYQLKKPTYIGCTVALEWLTFSVFRRWMVAQDWEGKELDKDLLSPGNKIYSPNTCIFVSSQVNALLSDSAASRGKYPQGVSFEKGRCKFRSNIRRYGKIKSLGRFATLEQASAAYMAAKSAHIIEVAQSQHGNIKTALMRHAFNIEE